MVVLQRGLTLEEFLALPESEPELEYFAGVVTKKVPASLRHSRLQGFLLEMVNRFAMPARLASAFPELRTTFAGASWVPDVAVYRWDRIPIDDQGEIVDEDAWEPPDIAIEIVSANESIGFVRRKCAWYVENGVRIAVMVDPGPHSRPVILFRPGVQPTTIQGPEVITLDDVLPGFQLTVQQLFDALTFR